jgi:hypothetical protein
MIKLIKILAGPSGCYDIGSRVNLPADVEAEIVAAGAAEYVASPQTATAPDVVEIAVAPDAAAAQATVQKMPVETRQSFAKAKK